MSDEESDERNKDEEGEWNEGCVLVNAHCTQDEGEGQARPERKLPKEKPHFMADQDNTATAIVTVTVTVCGISRHWKKYYDINRE